MQGEIPMKYAARSRLENDLILLNITSMLQTARNKRHLRGRELAKCPRNDRQSKGAPRVEAEEPRLHQCEVLKQKGTSVDSDAFREAQDV